MNFLYYFRKKGGIKLLLKYLSIGVLGTALIQFITLGKSRTALEILSLSVDLKIRKKLLKQYRKNLEIFDSGYIDKVGKSSNKIWICWFQGVENAPNIVKKCIESVKINLPSKEIVILTQENINDFVSLPEYIETKFKNNTITITHYTDLLRLELLTTYGGTWIDATVFCSTNSIPDYFFNSDLFLFQSLKPGRDGFSNYVSTWFISAKSNNKILLATKYLCFEYWKKNNSLIDYYLIHQFISIVLEFYKNEWDKVVPRDNSTPHILLLRLFEQYDEKMWKSIIEQVPFHKLSFKFDKDQILLKNTYYERIMKLAKNC